MIKSIMKLKRRNWKGHWEGQPKGMEKSFLKWGASRGIEWSKLTEEDIEYNYKPSKEGVDIVFMRNTIRAEIKNSYGEYDMEELHEGVVLNVLIDGKPAWYRSTQWRPLATMTETMLGKKLTSLFIGQNDYQLIKAGPRGEISRGQYDGGEQWGAQIRGLGSIASYKKLAKKHPGAVVYMHISLDESKHYMTGIQKRKERAKARTNAHRFISERRFKKSNHAHYRDLYNKAINNPGALYQKYEVAKKALLEVINNPSISTDQLENTNRASYELTELSRDYRNYRRDFKNSWGYGSILRNAERLQHRILSVERLFPKEFNKAKNSLSDIINDNNEIVAIETGKSNIIRVIGDEKLNKDKYKEHLQMYPG
tara:strand:- start:18540 stop:19643 length:1104 start_codon:yes stop_codon:yes gene_type:complete